MKKASVLITGWVVSLIAATALGYALRKPETAKEDSAYSAAMGEKRKTQSLPDLSVANANLREIGDGDSIELARDWPEGVPRSGQGLKDHVVKILQDSDPVERNLRYLQLLSLADKDNVGELYKAWDYLRKQGIARWECQDPMNYRSGQVNGAEVLGARKGTDYDLSVASAVSVQLEGWSSVEPQKARQWVESLPDGRFREEMIESLVASTAESDPDGAQELLAQLPEDMQFNTASTLASRMREKKGLGETLDWLGSLETGGEESQSPVWAESAAVNLIQDGIRVTQMAGGTAEALETRLSHPAVTAQRLNQLGRSFVQADPNKAIEWAVRVESQQSEKAVPGQILVAMVQSAFPDKLEVFEKFLIDSPNIAGRDAIVRSLYERLVTEFPDKAHVWADQLNEAEAGESDAIDGQN